MLLSKVNYFKNKIAEYKNEIKNIEAEINALSLQSAEITHTSEKVF